MLIQLGDRSFHFCNGRESSPSLKNATLGDEIDDRLHSSRARHRSGRMNSLIWLALVLFVIWIVVRVVFAITSALLHLVWVVAAVLLIVWLVRRFL